MGTDTVYVGQDYPSGLSKRVPARLVAGPMLRERSCHAHVFRAGHMWNWRTSLPSGRWDQPALEKSRVLTRSVATATDPEITSYPGKSVSTSTQVQEEDWCSRESGWISPGLAPEEPSVVSEITASMVATMRVATEEVVLEPQPEQVVTMLPEHGRNVPPGLAEQDTASPIEVSVLLPDLAENCPLCGVPSGGLRLLGKHFAVRHAGVPVTYECRKCAWRSPNSHSISCHVPKCRGRARVPSGDPGIACDLCEARFATEVGVAQHKRHVHPVEWNKVRLERRGARGGGIKATKLWSVAEVETLIRLIREHGDSGATYQLIADELGRGKTAEQVRSKKRLLRIDTASNSPDDAEVEEERLESLAVRSSSRSPPSLVATRVREAVARGESEGGEEIRAIAALIRDVDQNPCLIETSASDIISKLGRRVDGPKRPRPVVREQTQEKGWVRRLARRKREYREAQYLYSRDQARLAAQILDGAASQECALPVDQVYGAFREKWETVGQFHGLGEFRTGARADNWEFYSPILAAEVKENLMRMANGTAPGPDRISKKALLDWDPRGEQLARLYTTWLIGGVIPRVFKECRTKLLPKSSDPVELQDIGGWRPVTIGSMVTRLFSRILTMRLTRACPINPRQRGFLASSSGCAENLLIFDEIVRRSRRDGGPLAVVFVDFARAFDSISHEHILCVLEEGGLDRHVIGLIRNSYVDCVTRVGCVEGMTPPIQMKVGVKQGDPMSPLLFNLAMDPLIHKLETAGTGLKWGDLSIATLAFADDLVLVSDSEEGMGRSLGILEKFCQLTGLRVQPRKCHGFFMDKGVVNGCGTWEICGSPIHMIPPGESVRYLGVQVGPGRGVMEPDLIPTVHTWIERITEAPLKPSQRMRVLNSFALPRIIYQADLGKVTVTKLAQIDGIVRKAVKKWLHLSPSTCNGLLYSRNRDGGLGLLKLERLIPSVRTKRIYRMSRSPDIWTRRMTSHSVSKSDWEMLWVQAGGERGSAPVMGAVEAAPTDVERSPDYPDWRREENLAWSALRVQGVGADQFRGDRTSSSWIAEPASVGFAQRHWLAALALRAGVYPTREFLARGKEKSGAACRRCPARLESCSHILGQCPFVQANRIARHNKVCVLLATEVERFGWTVIREFRLEDAAGGLKIPDLVCKKADTVLIVDVTVRYEMDGETLKRAASEKVEHYLPVGQQITDKVGGRCFKVMGFPVGARGKWPASNNTVLAELGVPAGRMRTFARLVSRRTLLYSLDILRDFMREPAGRGTRVALIPAATGAAN